MLKSVITVLSILLFAQGSKGQYQIDSIVLDFKNIPVSGYDGLNSPFRPGGYSNKITNMRVSKRIVVQGSSIQLRGDTILLTDNIKKIALVYDTSTNVIRSLYYDSYRGSPYSDGEWEKYYIENVILSPNATGASTSIRPHYYDHITRFAYHRNNNSSGGQMYYTDWDLGTKFSDSAEFSITIIGKIPLDVKRFDIAKDQISVNPNPADGFINVSVDLNDDDAIYEVYDNIGRLTQSGTLVLHSAKIDVSTLKIGCYRLIINKHLSFPFMIVR